MPKDTKTLGNSKARACESLGFVHKKGCARVLTHLLCITSVCPHRGGPYTISLRADNQSYNVIRDFPCVLLPDG